MLFRSVCGVCAAGALIYAGVSAMDKAGVSTDGILSSKPTLTVWYTEEKLEDYLSAMALEYQDNVSIWSYSIISIVVSLVIGIPASIIWRKVKGDDSVPAPDTTIYKN